MRVPSCLSIMKTGWVGGKHPATDLLIGMCWLAPFFSFEYTSTARAGLSQYGADERRSKCQGIDCSTWPLLSP